MTGRGPLAGRATVVCLGSLVLVLSVLSLPLAHATAGQSVAGAAGGLVIAAPFALVGTILAYRQPRNAVGWTLLGFAVFYLVDSDATTYTILDYRQRGGHLLFGPLAVLVQPSWAPAIVCMVLALLLFPDARLPLGRWRWILWPFLGISALWVLGAFGLAADAIATHAVHITSSGNLEALERPTGSAAWWGVVEWFFFPAIIVTGFAAVARQIVSYRGSTGERRLQLKWLLTGAVVFLVCGMALLVGSGPASGVRQIVGNIGSVGLGVLPLCIGIAILKYRLFEIDRLISRTLSYAIVTGLLIGVYVGLIALTTRALPLSSPIGVAASTLAAAALFSPLRRWVQRVVDRRFNRAHYDAEATVAAFSAGLRDEVDLATVQTDLIAVVNLSMQPSHVSVWLRERSPV